MIDEKHLFRLALYGARYALPVRRAEHEGFENEQVECALQEGYAIVGIILGRLIEMTVKHSGLHRAMSSQLAKTGDTTLPGLATIEERFGGDKRPTMQNWLLAETPDLARSSEVFYYSSAEFLTVWQGQPSRNNGLISSGGRLELIWTEHRASRSRAKRKSHTCSGDRNSSNRELWKDQWLSQPT
jgi:hypothetical protein